jgi:hypothetical protein
LSEIRAFLNQAMLPANFFVGGGLKLRWEHLEVEDVSWEIFHGRLLDAAQTRFRRTFEAWNVYKIDADGLSAGPILSLRLDFESQQLHVLRSIYSYAWEGYHAGDGVYLSRETRNWVRELVGTIELARFPTSTELHSEVACRLFQAVVGTSRLPLHSVEAPLPEFSLGQLAYFFRCDLNTHANTSQPLRCYRDLIELATTPDLSRLHQVKLLEIVLRAAPEKELRDAAALLQAQWRSYRRTIAWTLALFRELFNDVALTPYTDLVPKTLHFLELLEQSGWLSAPAHVDFLAYLLRQLGRHLIAYDLITFHHQGANYPDILVLDLLLKASLRRADSQPHLFETLATDSSTIAAEKRLRRRALRQAWLQRQRYAGHAVPDAPTSPGENARILPPPHTRVPDEQITNPAKRTKRLFADDPLAAHLTSISQRILEQSIGDLKYSEELRELGMAVFLDRPLGVFKAPLEPDQTPLLSYAAFSRTIAQRGLDYLHRSLRLLSDGDYAERSAAVRDLQMEGISISRPINSGRPGVSLADAFRVADDFVILRTTARSAQEFLGLFDFTPIRQHDAAEYLDSPHRITIVSAPALGEEKLGILIIFDALYRRRLELQIDPKHGYETRHRLEYPAAGLQVMAQWQPDASAALGQILMPPLTIHVASCS